MWSNYSGNSTGTSDLEVRKVNKIDHLSSHAHVVHTAAKQVIWRRGKNEKVCEMSKNEKCTCRACKTIVFHYQICKFVTFLLPSSSSALTPYLHNGDCFAIIAVCSHSILLRNSTKGRREGSL